jgi:CDP-glycerol glycerophosphotransferase
MRVVWQSFEGRYSDSPAVMFERWSAERPGDEHLWLAAAGQSDTFPAGIDTVPIYTEDCVEALGECDLLIANTHTDVSWAKKPGACYLQTWHGTPLKRVHRDVLWAPPGRLDRLSRDVARWDLLLSPNAESTPRLRRAFAFTGEVIESGYPRNDILSSPDRELIGRRVRRELGIPDGRTVVLYTPTWRDDVVLGGGTGPVELGLQIEELVERLGEDYCVLLRMHSLVGDRWTPVQGDRVRDVSRHPNISELFLAADLMITDYSSTMFDYAVTGRPILFFTYDMEGFRDTVRGFYFDLEEQAPGPLLRTQGELVEAILAVEEVREKYADAYERFRERYCSLEDGHATERILGRLWGVRAEVPASR